MDTQYTSKTTVNDFSLPFANFKYSADIAASTDTLFTVPDNNPRYKAVVKVPPGSFVWVANNQVAAAPVGAAFASSSSEMVNGSINFSREVVRGDVLHFFSVTGPVSVSIVLYPTL